MNMKAVKKAEGKEKGDVPSWAFSLIVIYFIFEYIRPQYILTFLYPLKIPFILTISLILFFIFKGDKEKFKDPIIKKNIIFIFLTFFGLIYAVNHFWIVENGKVLTVYLLAVAMPLITILNTGERLLKFFYIWLIIHIVVALLTIKSGGIGASSFLRDENDLSLTLIIALPYAYFLFQSQRLSAKFRYLSLISFLGILLAIVATESRGGFIGMAGAVLMILYLSKKKMRNAIVLIILGIVSISFIPESYISEMETIEDVSDPTRNDRFYLWARAIHMFKENPLFGVGSGNFPWRLPEYQLKDPTYDSSVMPLRGGFVAHSLYFSIISEYGLIGTILFILLIKDMYGRLRSIRESFDEKNNTDIYRYEFVLLSKAMTASLTGFLLSSAFITNTVYPHLWYMIGMLLALDYTNKKYINESNKNE